MKTFYLIITLFIILSCSSNPSAVDEPFQQQRVGNWLITSPETAEMVEISSTQRKSTSRSTAAVDTVVINSLKNRSVDLTKEVGGGGRSFTLLTYIDSTIVFTKLNEDIRAKVIENISRNTFLNVRSMRRTTKRTIVGMESGHNCGEKNKLRSPDENIKLVFTKKDSVIKVIKLNLLGFDDTVRNILCN